MKRKIQFLVLFLFIGLGTLSAKETTTTFKVGGVCGMCEQHIEKAALSVKGVNAAQWDKTSKIITLKYDDSVANLKNIEKTIAAAGYDTPMVKATDKDYNALPKCCQYQRSPKSGK